MPPSLQFDPRLPVSNLGALTHTSAHAAKWLLRHAELTDARAIVALDVIEYDEKQKHLKPKGDSVLYEGMDSAVKATLYSKDHDPRHVVGPHATLHVPVLVLQREFFDVAIDGGEASQPERLRRGYHTFLYPGAERPAPMVCIIWTRDELGDLVVALDHLFDDFFGHMKIFLTNAKS